MKKTQKPNGKNIEIALELLELSLLLRADVKRAKKGKQCACRKTLTVAKARTSFD